MKELTDEEIYSAACKAYAYSYDINKICSGAKWYRDWVRAENEKNKIINKPLPDESYDGNPNKKKLTDEELYQWIPSDENERKRFYKWVEDFEKDIPAREKILIIASKIPCSSRSEFWENVSKIDEYING